MTKNSGFTYWLEILCFDLFLYGIEFFRNLSLINEIWKYLIILCVRMLFEGTGDATTLSYWLNWWALSCEIWVFASFTFALWMIWNYEVKDRLGHSRRGTQQDKNKLRGCEAWTPCLIQIHPICLLAFRVCAFGMMLASLIVKALVNGASMFYYYTQ